MTWRFENGDHVVFHTDDSDYRWADGNEFVVERRLTEKEADLCETGPMYVIVAVSGPFKRSKVHAFDDELVGVNDVVGLFNVLVYGA